MGRKSITGGVRAKGNRIQLDFEFDGVRYRPTIECSPTPASLMRARKRLEDIKQRIARGCFNFEEEFPEYRFIEKVAATSGPLTCNEVFDAFLKHCEARVARRDLAYATYNGYRKLLAQIWRRYRRKPRALAGGARGRRLACEAQSRDRRQEPAFAFGRSDADAPQIDGDRPPLDDNPQRLEPRLANGKRLGEVTQTPRRRPVASQEPGLERLAVGRLEQSKHGGACAHDQTWRGEDREPRLVIQPLSRRGARIEGRRGLFAREGDEIDSGRWRQMGQSRRS